MRSGGNGLPILRLVSGGACRNFDMSGKQGATPRLPPHYSAHQDAAKHCDLPKTLGQELREHYQPPQDLPHQMFTLLMRLNDNSGSPHETTERSQADGSSFVWEHSLADLP